MLFSLKSLIFRSRDECIEFVLFDFLE